MVVPFIKLPKKDKVLIYISWAVKISILIVFITSIVQLKIGLAGLSLLFIVLSFLPAMLGHTFKVILPPEFDTLFALFLYASFILGELKDYYDKFVWWDITLHGLSAIMFGITGFIIIYSLYYTHRVVFSPRFAAIFAFSFALSIGAVWEIFEFFMDQFFGANMQKSGLVDTMWDLIVDSIGALIVSISGYFYLKGGDSFIMEKFVKKFINMNEKRLRK